MSQHSSLDWRKKIGCTRPWWGCKDEADSQEPRGILQLGWPRTLFLLLLMGQVPKNWVFVYTNPIWEMDWTYANFSTSLKFLSCLMIFQNYAESLASSTPQYAKKMGEKWRKSLFNNPYEASKIQTPKFWVHTRFITTEEGAFFH